MADAIRIFIVCFIVFAGLGVLVPIANEAFSSTNNIDSKADDIESAVFGSTYLDMAINIVSCMFWTFGLANWINILLLPFRIVGLMSLYYIIVPTK